MLGKSTKHTRCPLFSLYDAKWRRNETRQSQLLNTRHDVEELLGKTYLVMKVAIVHLQLLQQTKGCTNKYLGHTLVHINTKIANRPIFRKLWSQFQKCRYSLH